MHSEYSSQISEIVELQQEIQHLNPLLEKLFPIAFVENGHFLIYDIPPGGQNYDFIKKEELPFPVPQGVRAAFPLDLYDNRMTCIVTPDIFDEPRGYVIIFHEFIHCQQFEICEMALKSTLEVFRKAQAAENHMWEINHPFPYSTPEFTQLYEKILAANSLPPILDIHRQLKEILDPEDYEYMIWQEWKEGYARFVENQISAYLGLPENHGGTSHPFDRVLFYEGGARFIDRLVKDDPDLLTDINSLFYRMT